MAKYLFIYHGGKNPESEEQEHNTKISDFFGFPIYGLVSGTLDCFFLPLKKGKRPSEENSPGGEMGTMNLSKGVTLDECNGRKTVPEFPKATYAYFLTNQWPVIPRCFKGTPSDDFRKVPPPE